jgi:hypothetical protein
MTRADMRATVNGLHMDDDGRLQYFRMLENMMGEG